MKRLPLVGSAILLLCAWAHADMPVPAAGASPRIDAIKKSGVLRVGVLANAPWLVENTSGSGEAWSGPAWLLAKEYAKRLNVTLQAIPVSHETKVPVLASNQVDISVTPLAETAERLKVVDFIIYSSTSVCMFGLASNPKFAQAKSVDELNRPDITVAYYTGGGEEGWVKERFPKAQLRGVAGSGVAPVEEVMARRADAVPINRSRRTTIVRAAPRKARPSAWRWTGTRRLSCNGLGRWRRRSSPRSRLTRRESSIR